MRYSALAAIVLLGIQIQVVDAAPIDLTGMWAVTGVGDGQTWVGSSLTFTSQTPSGADFSMEGSFDWLGSGGAFGRELFTGTFFADLTLELQGFQIVPPAFNIFASHYDAAVSTDGTQITGVWSGPGSGTWTATRETTGVIPEPGTVLLLGAGLSMVAMYGCQRRRH